MQLKVGLHKLQPTNRYCCRWDIW